MVGAIQSSRIQVLKNAAIHHNSAYVLYWMQQSQRTECNHALEYAIDQANKLGKPLVVGFGLMDDYPEANARHYAFMLQGLAEVEQNLRARKIKFVIRHGSPDEVALTLGQNAALVIADRGYLRHQKLWRKKLAQALNRRVVQIETDVLVPVETVSDKREYAARTLRPKLHKLWPEYLKPLASSAPEKSSLNLELKSDFDLTRIDQILNTLKLDCSVGPVKRFQGGYSAARRLLNRFVKKNLDGYAEQRSEPAAQQSSMLSPYLHFGQIAALEIALAVQTAQDGIESDAASYLEELIVRRELAINYVQFELDYDKYRALPEWAQKTLAKHKPDPRPHRYTRAQLEAAATHDPYWNAAMQEMLKTGYMHNTLRMYWGKKILQWCRTPEYAFRLALELNNKDLLDGRDPNSYANIGWCFGLHDRPWPEREIFGTVRSMTASGLERKYDMAAYVAWTEGLE